MFVQRSESIGPTFHKPCLRNIRAEGLINGDQSSGSWTGIVTKMPSTCWKKRGCALVGSLTSRELHHALRQGWFTGFWNEQNWNITERTPCHHLWIPNFCRCREDTCLSPWEAQIAKQPSMLGCKFHGPCPGHKSDSSLLTLLALPSSANYWMFSYWWSARTAYIAQQLGMEQEQARSLTYLT